MLLKAKIEVFKIQNRCAQDIGTYIKNNPRLSVTDLGNAFKFKFCIPKIAQVISEVLDELLMVSGLTKSEVGSIFSGETIPENLPLSCVKHDIDEFYQTMRKAVEMWQKKVDSMTM